MIKVFDALRAVVQIWLPMHATVTSSQGLWVDIRNTTHNKMMLQYAEYWLRQPSCYVLLFSVQAARFVS